MSRLAQYLAKSTEALERLRYLREYRTPFLLRYGGAEGRGGGTLRGVAWRGVVQHGVA